MNCDFEILRVDHILIYMVYIYIYAEAQNIDLPDDILIYGMISGGRDLKGTSSNPKVRVDKSLWSYLKHLYSTINL